MNVTSEARPDSAGAAPPGAGQIIALVLSWAAVSVPLVWGVTETVLKALALFR